MHIVRKIEPISVGDILDYENNLWRVERIHPRVRIMRKGFCIDGVNRNLAKKLIKKHKQKTAK